ncbi:hypothetical protein Gotur_006071 [Gossypium turneri]
MVARIEIKKLKKCSTSKWKKIFKIWVIKSNWMPTTFILEALSKPRELGVPTGQLMFISTHMPSFAPVLPTLFSCSHSHFKRCNIVHVDDNDDDDNGEHLRDNTSGDVVANDVSNIAGSIFAAPKMITPNQIPSWLSM